MKGRWRYFHRSMFGQTALLTLLFVGWGVYMVAITPIMDNAPLTNFDPLDFTLSRTRNALSVRVLEAQYGPKPAFASRDGDVLRETARLNPNFRYYAQIGDRSFGTAPAARFFDRYGLGAIDKALASTRDVNLCAQTEKKFREPDGLAYVSYVNCGKPVYYELYGIAAPLPVTSDPVIGGYRHWLWTYSQNFLTIAGLAFLLFLVVLIGNMILIRRVAKRIGTLDPDGIGRPLPERGLPTEVLPLVRAMNLLVASNAEAQKKRRFFLSAAAHEMRTPLTVLRTRLALLDDGPLKDKLQRDAHNLVQLVNQLLTLVRIEGSCSTEQVDVAECCRHAMADLEPISGARSIQIGFAAPPGPLVMAGQASLLQVAIGNILDNALSFTPDGGKVDMLLTHDGTIVIRDFGPGIPEDRIDTIFEPFVSFPANRKGHGLGLAIVQAIVDAHGGTIIVENAESGGARFTIRFHALP